MSEVTSGLLIIQIQIQAVWLNFQICNLKFSIQSFDEFSIFLQIPVKSPGFSQDIYEYHDGIITI